MMPVFLALSMRAQAELAGGGGWGGLGGGGEEVALHLKGKALNPSELPGPGTLLTLEGSLAPWA